MEGNKLLTTKTGKLFFSYLLPGIGATLATSIYVLVDTIMIGQYEGNAGIVALNIVLPIFAVAIGLGALFGVGGGVMYSVSRAKGNEREARGYFLTATILMAAVTLVVWLLMIIFFEPLIKLLGATESSLPLVRTYGMLLVLGSPLFGSAIFLQTLLRNDRAPRLAMIATIAGGALNIILDYIFIFPLNMGIAGAAYATIIAYGVNVAVCLIHFFRKRNGLKFARPTRRNFLEVPFSGLASFFIELAGGFTIFLFNRQILTYVGEYGVVVYGVISNLSIVALSIFNGVGQAAQPLISANFGAGQPERVKRIVITAGIVAFSIGLFLYALGATYPSMWVFAFSSERTEEVLKLANVAVRFALIGFAFASINILMSAYFQACLKPKIAFVLTVLRGFAFVAMFAFLLPPFFFLGVWFVTPLAEIITAAITFVVLAIQVKKSAKPTTLALKT